MLVGDKSAPPLCSSNDFLEVLGADQVFNRHNSNSVVGCQKVEECGISRRVLQLTGPSGQGATVLGDEGVQHKRREGKLVDKMGLVGPVAEVRNIVLVRHICLSDDLRGRIGSLCHSTEELHHFVRLFQMDARCSDILPQIANGVEADVAGAFFDVKEE